MKTKDLLKAYKVITEIMETNKLTMDTSFRRVQCWLSNAVCNSLKDEASIGEAYAILETSLSTK